MYVSDLKKRLAIEILPVYFIKGEDLFLRGEAVKIISELIDREYSDFNLSFFDADSPLSDAIAECNTVPVFSDKRVVVVKSSADFGEAEKAQLAAYLANPSDFTLLAVVDDAKKSVLATLYKYGDVVNCEQASDGVIRKYIDDDCRRNNAVVEFPAVRLLMKYTDCNMSRIMLELQKLYAYCDGRPITESDVENLVAPDNEYTTFKLTDALSAGNNETALTVLNCMLEKGAKPSAVLATVTNAYRRMLEARVSSLPEDKLAAVLGVKPYAVTLAKAVAKKYTQVELKSIVDKLHALEFDFKSGLTDEREALSSAVTVLIKK